MATKKIVPRANGEGAIGDNTAGAEKYWGGGYFNVINGTDAIEMAAFNNILQWKANTTYASGDVFFTSELKAGQYLECTTDGTSGSAKPTIPASVVPNTTTITDNTVTWTVREISSTQIDESYSRQPSTLYQTGDIRFLYGVLPVGWFLECSTAGTSGSGDLTIATPTEGDKVTDGTVEWTIKKMGTGGGGDGVPLGAIIAYSANGELPEGYLLCDGSAVSRTMFPDLFTAIGTTYGAGDGSTTFNVPDYNAAKRFAQGDTVAGTVKQAGLPTITGSVYWSDNTGGLAVFYEPTGAFGGTVYSGGSPTRGGVSSSGDKAVCLTIDASRSSAVYGNSTTVQPNALTTRFIIKAFDGQTAASALIDITQYANELANKADRSLSNLTQAGEDHYLDNDFAIIYPNGGTEANPANVTVNSRYVESNPFPGYYVNCISEVLSDGNWVNVNFIGIFANNLNQGAGVRATLMGDNIIVQTGGLRLVGNAADNGNPLSISNSTTSIPCRVKIWKIGKIPTA